MATRMLQRRGTASQWLSTNSGNGPILEPGEIGFESDTNKFKIGDGTNHWVDLTYFTDAESITTALNTIIDGAPAALDTLNELAAALGDDPSFLASLATEEYVDTAVSGATFDASLAAGTGLDWNGSQFDVDTTLIQARVTDVSDTEIGYLNGVTSDIQTQIDAKLESATAGSTYATITNLDLKAPLANPAFTGTVTGITSTMVGLNNVDNTSDANKPVSDATQTALNAKLALAGGTMSGSLAMGTNKITGLGAPTDSTDATTKAYVDAVSEGLNVHPSSRVATSGNGDLSTALQAGDIIDGVTLVAGDRVLVRAQTAPSQNGIYVVQASGAPIRALDFDTPTEIVPGDFTFVREGTSYGSSGWVQTEAVTTVGTDSISFTQFSGAGTYLAGNGLTLTGNSFSINTTATADLSTAQTLTNKTLTSPVINTPTGITKSDVGLSNVDNTSDADKPVSTAQQTALDLKLASATAATTYETITNVALKAPLASPIFTGTVDFTGATVNGISSYEAPTLGSTSIASGATVTNVSGLTINSTTIPTSKTLVDTDSSQTLTNKTLTDPKINLAFDAETVSYTAVLANNGQVVTMNVGAGNTFSIPTNASVAFPIGTQINVLQIGTGQTTIQAVTSGTTTVLSTAATAAQPKLRVRYSAATCLKAGTDLWYVFGDIA